MISFPPRCGRGSYTEPYKIEAIITREGERLKNPDQDMLLRLEGKVDELIEGSARMQAAFTEQLRQQDVKLYDEIKEMSKAYLHLAERLSDYNAQLAIHIAGVQELRTQTRILQDSQNLMREHFDQRIVGLEKGASFGESLGVKIKTMASAVVIATAVVAVLKFLLRV